MTDFVRHRSRQFAFVMRSFYQPTIYISEAARQRKRVQIAKVQNFESVMKLRMLKFGGNRFDQPPANSFT